MRIATHRFIVVFSMALTAALTLGALSQNVVAQEATSPDESRKQIALTDAQIVSFHWRSKGHCANHRQGS